MSNVHKLNIKTLEDQIGEDIKQGDEGYISAGRKLLQLKEGTPKEQWSAKLEELSERYGRAPNTLKGYMSFAKDPARLEVKRKRDRENKLKKKNATRVSSSTQTVSPQTKATVDNLKAEPLQPIMAKLGEEDYEKLQTWIDEKASSKAERAKAEARKEKKATIEKRVELGKAQTAVEEHMALYRLPYTKAEFNRILKFCHPDQNKGREEEAAIVTDLLLRIKDICKK